MQAIFSLLPVAIWMAIYTNARRIPAHWRPQINIALMDRWEQSTFDYMPGIFILVLLFCATAYIPRDPKHTILFFPQNMSTSRHPRFSAIYNNPFYFPVSSLVLALVICSYRYSSYFYMGIWLPKYSRIIYTSRISKRSSMVRRFI